MNLPFFIKAAFMGCLFLVLNPASSQGKKAPSKPNIILFMVDDMGWQDTAVPFWQNEKGEPVETFLNKRYRTPHMETLASQGTRFTSAYAQPICSPTRVSLMTGMNSARHRVTNWTLKRDQSTDANSKHLIPPDWSVNGVQPAGTKPKGKTQVPLSGEEIEYEMKKPYVAAHTLPELLRKGGYVTVHCGKAHFGSRRTPGANPLNMGFDYNIAGTEIGGPGDYRGSHQYGNGDFKVRGLDENNYYQDDVFLTEALTIEALKRLDAIRNSPQESKKPFYLYMSHYAIHAPFNERGYDKRFADQYKNPQDGKPWSDNEKRYSGLIEGMDKSLGDIMAYLKKHGLDQNTIVIFMSDNGGLAISGRLGNELANYPLSAGKGSPREGGIREPMIVFWPGVTKPGTTCDAPVIIEDFFPSILEMAGVRKYNTVQKIDGKSFVPVLKGAKGDMNRSLLFHVPNVWGEGASFNSRFYAPFTALRVGDWKLIYWHQDQKMELFNTKEDISEKNNLLEKNPDKAKELAAEMARQLREKKALMPAYKKDNILGLPEGQAVPLPDKLSVFNAK